MCLLPTSLYTSESVAALDKAAIESGVPGYTLMRRAGAALLDCLKENFSADSNVLIVCGAGNNAGDGYVLARLAKQQGFSVTVCSLIDTTQLKADAAIACEHWQQVGEVHEFNEQLLSECDVIVDALLGTGLARDVAGEWQQCITVINASAKAVIAVDIPSGLHANTGTICGTAIEADYTVSFIGLKQGMFTASGRHCCGEIVFDDLQVPADIVAQQTVSAALLTQSVLDALPPRREDSHKGHFGHVLVVGGNTGMPGAVALTAKAALKAGAGLVTVVTRPEHVVAVATICPEAMVHGTETGQIDDAVLQRVSVCVAGPGMGQDTWAQRLFYQVSRLELPVLYDADALNLIASANDTPDNACVMTPHPGEASRLLNVVTNDIQADRFFAARQLHQQHAAVCVLKGSGTVIASSQSLSVCAAGTPAMASAGMGDVLSGIIAALIAQGMTQEVAANVGVFVHALAAEVVADGNDRGLLASEVVAALPHVLCHA